MKLVDAIASLIDQNSDFVFDALDGKTKIDQANGNQARETNINYRDEPVAFFFVLFGISIEALVTGPSKELSTLEPQTLEILSALKKILRPSVSGNAIFQEMIFSEAIELFDRLALTEGLDVQLVIVDIVRNLCLNHPSAKEKDEDGEHLSDEIEQLFELTRIIVLVLASVLPNLAEQTPSSRPQLPDEAVTLIQVSLEALVDASFIFPSIIKTDLHASIFHIFATILGTGVCQAVVVPQALPILRRFLQSLTSLPSPSSATIVNQLLSILYRFLSILANAQQRATDSAIPCAKNTLMACTILLTTASRLIPPQTPLLIRCLDEMLDYLNDLGLAKIAANCLRSLLLISPKSPTDEAIARHLFSPLVRFSLESTPDPENARSIVIQSLLSFTTNLAEKPSEPGSPSKSTATASPAVAAAFSILVPMLLTRAAAAGHVSFPESASRLLELAAADQVTFRGVVGAMSETQRAFMERVLREGGAKGRGGKGREYREEGSGEPAIALKLSFGGV